jgi:hypothetical protein
MKTITEGLEFTIGDDIFLFKNGEFVWMDAVVK